MRKISNIKRSILTNVLIDSINHVILCGDHIAPDEGGWDGHPEDPSSSYIPYVVLSTGTVGKGTGPLADTQSDLKIPYLITSYGPTRAIAEESCEAARGVLLDLPRTMVLLDGDMWKVQQVEASSLGAVVRNDSAEASKFSEVDTLTVWLSKEIKHG